MHRIASSEKETATETLEKYLRDAEQFRINFGLMSQEYSGARSVSASDSANRFYTLSSIVRLLTEVMEPYYGRILETFRLANSRCVNRGMNRVKSRRVHGKWWRCASTSGGKLVALARFVSELKKNPAVELFIHGVEKTVEFSRLCRLILAVHDLEGDIRNGGQVKNYYDDPHNATGNFDFVLARFAEVQPFIHLSRKPD